MVAGECDAEGALVQGTEPLTVEELSWRPRDADVERDLSAPRAAGMVECHDGVFSIPNIEERHGQPLSERLTW